MAASGSPLAAQLADAGLPVLTAVPAASADELEATWRRLDCPDALALVDGGPWAIDAPPHPRRGTLGAVAPQIDEWPVMLQASPFADARGRVFSEDPREDRVDEVQIDAWSGDGAGGDGAGGAGAPRRYRLSRSGGRASPEGDGPYRLSTAQVGRLAELVLAAEAICRTPVALEWALSDGEIWITRAGPIESPLPWGIERGEPAQGDGWTRTNAGEIFPLPMTPMTWSLMGAPLDDAFAHMYHQPRWTNGRRFVALVGGYVYFNFGLLNWITVQQLGFPGREMLMAVGGPGEDEGFDSYSDTIQWGKVLRALPYGLRRTRHHRTLPRRWSELEAETARRRDRLRRLDLRELDDSTLLAELRSTGDWLQGLSNFLMDAQSAAFGTFGLLSYLLARWLGDDDDATAVIQGLPGIRTAEGNRALARLAQRAAADAATRALIEATEPEVLLETLRAGAETRWLAEELDAFLAEYGHRSAGELELMEPRWSDEPALLLRPFRQYVLRPGQESADEAWDRQVAARQEAERRIAARLSAGRLRRWLPWRRLVVKDYIHWTQVYAPLRENPKFSLLALVQEQRRVLFELAKRIVERGALGERDDVFFLFADELDELVRSAGDARVAGRMHSRVARRRKQWRIWRAVDPPAVLGERPVLPERTEQRDSAASASAVAAHTLRGVGASPGMAEGTAHVARDAEEGNRIEPGQVLVARFTDPGWTPIFPLAAAVVTDIGGRLSHGAIVAREYGIPAVVNVREATATIRSGMRVRVDGTRGTVEILAPDGA